VFIINRTPALLKVLQDPKLIDVLSDPDSSAQQQPPYAKNWHRSVKPEYAVLVGICTHLGCIPKFIPGTTGAPAGAWFGGYFCPCHGSKYDLAGRVFNGVPAPYNLPVPPHNYVNDRTVRIGENPKGETWDSAPSSSFDKAWTAGTIGSRSDAVFDGYAMTSDKPVP
jgi:ubiquinol-cytochrome c reductase iron-sulfur subunit